MKTKYLKKIERIVIRIGADGGRFIGEHNMVNRPILDIFIEELKQLLHDFSEELIGEIVSFENGIEGIEEMVELDSVLYKVHELVESLIKKRDKLLK